jgi:FkbM family methyltransferase
VELIVYRFLARTYSKLLQGIFRPLCYLTGKGGGKFVKFLPKGQTYQVADYCGFKFNVNTIYPIEASVWLAGVYDVATSNFLKKVIKKGDVFLDVGANCGTLTLVAASLIGEGKIYAFEPGPSIRSRLQSNLDLNPQLEEVVTIVPYGLGKDKFQGLYSEDQSNRGNGFINREPGIAVDILSLDEWVSLEKLDKIDVIKIDVEGMEYDVLLGSKSVLEKYQPILYFETIHTAFIPSIYEFLSGLGYKIVSPKNLYSEIPFDGPYPTNSVAIHPSRADRLMG